MRARSGDLLRNAPLAAGAVKTVATNVIGTGLQAYPRIDRHTLELTHEEATEWNRRMKRLFRIVASTTTLDVAGRHTFFEQQHTALNSSLERGDVMVLRRQNKQPKALTSTAFQLIEADRVCNPTGAMDRPGFAAGVEADADGRVKRFHVASTHPREMWIGQPVEWTTVPAIGPKSGGLLAGIVGWMTRPGQSRGVPYLATAMESLKQIHRYGDAELMAAVGSAMFTMFIETPDGGDPLGNIACAAATDPRTGRPLPPQYTMGPGAVGRLLPGEKASFADPKRPSSQFQPFVQAWAEQIGVSLELPYEILLKHFTSSYSAARGAQLEAWRFFWMRREWMAATFCQPVYEAVVAEAIARDWIEAPGFFDDPFIRLAYLRTLWVGPEPGQIDPRSEVEAAKLRVEAGFSTREEETFALTGGDWEENHEQQVIEEGARRRDGLASVDGPMAPAAVLAPAERDAREQQEQAEARARRGL